MNSSRMKYVATALLAALFLSGPLLAAQGGQRRVFSNEDVESPAPPPAAPAETAEPVAPTPASQLAATPETTPSGPQEELKRLVAQQGVLGQAYDELTARIQEETSQILVTRWTAMAECLANLLKEYQGFVSQAQTRVQQGSQPQPAAQQPPQSTP